MSVRFFLDSNIIVYAVYPHDPRKQNIARDLIRTALHHNRGCISYQVVQETLNVLIKKARSAISPSDAHEILKDTLAPLCRVFASIAMFDEAIMLQTRYQYSFYDSLIIAAALRASCTVLYSEDLQHDQDIEGVRIVNPFL